MDGTGRAPSSQFSTATPHSARIWNYWLGGKDNYAVDREVGDKIRAAFPEIIDIARHARAFLGRAVRHLAGQAGIRQFLDIGTGLPTVDNTHEVAQRRFFDGLEVLEPGIVSSPRWRPDPTRFQAPEVDSFCAVARKP